MMTKKQQLQALSSLMFLAKKRDGTIKGRVVADGSTQREYTKKEDDASPTVSNGGIMITGAIEAHKRRNVIILDLLNAYLHAETDEDVVMLLRGKLAKLMVKVDHVLYRQYVFTSSKGETMLYVKM